MWLQKYCHSIVKLVRVSALKMKIYFTILILAFLSFHAIAQEEHTCNFLTKSNFDSELASIPYYFILWVNTSPLMMFHCEIIFIRSFFVPPCSHSIKYIPFWNKLVDRYKGSKKLKIACVNCQKERKLCDSLGVLG